MNATRFNELFPIGTKVKVHPIIGSETDVFVTKTRSEAWELYSGEPVVKVEGKTGGYSLEAITVIV